MVGHGTVGTVDVQVRTYSPAAVLDIRGFVVKK